MDRSTFFHHLRRSGLLGGQAVDEAVARFADAAQGQAIARVLVAESALTEFQAKKILAGKANQLVLGPYRLLDQLGRGMTGPVFKAEHRTIGRLVAIKVIHPRALDGPAAVDHFAQEVRAAAQLHHPGIVSAYDLGVARGRHFLVMEYIDGPSLQTLVQTHGPVPIGLARELMRQVAVALHYAHEKGMVHRGIKPAHVLIAPPAGSALPLPSLPPWREEESASGTDPHAHCPLRSPSPAPAPVAKLIDFGLASLHNAGIAVMDGTIAVEPGTVWGTVEYLAPEQAEDVQAGDIRSDLYSLGCSFYFALTGQVPFPGENDLDRLAKHLLYEAPLVTTIRPEVPAAFAGILQRLMAKDPAERFQTPAQLAQELADGCPIWGRGAVTAVMHDDPSAQLPTAETKQPQSPPRVPEPPAGADDTRKPLPLPDMIPPPIDTAFVENWRRWTDIIAAFLEGRGGPYRADPQTFHRLHRQLVADCEAQARCPEGKRREFFQRLAELVKPWLSPEVLRRTDREILSSLFWLCQQAELGLTEIAATESGTGGSETLLGAFLSLFKKRRE
jgi:serine/threonine-protein kinase